MVNGMFTRPTIHCSKPDKSILPPPFCLFKLHFNIIRPYVTGGLLPWRCLTETLYAFLPCPIHAIRPAHMITLTVLDEPSSTSTPLDPSIPLTQCVRGSIETGHVSLVTWKTVTSVHADKSLDFTSLYSKTPLIRTLVIRIGLALRANCGEFCKTDLPWNYRLSDQVQYSFMASRTSNQTWSKGLDAGTYCK
jgi:hypothetical protein